MGLQRVRRLSTSRMSTLVPSASCSPVMLRVPISFDSLANNAESAKVCCSYGGYGPFTNTDLVQDSIALRMWYDAS